MQININEAKTKLSELIVRVESGEEITIARAGKPVARLVPIHEHQGKRTAGLAKGKVTVRDDFDAPLPAEILAEFR